MDKIRICHISEATAGGVYKHLLQLAESMDREQYEQSFILSPLKNPVLTKTEHFMGHKLHLVNMLREINPLSDIVSLYQIIKILKQNRYHVIHCHSSKAGVLGRVAGWLCGHRNIIYTPHCFSFHEGNSYLKNLIFASIEKVASKMTKTIVCVAQGEMSEALKWKVASKEKMIVIPNGIEIPESHSVEEKKRRQTDFLIKHGYRGDESIIGFVGRLSPQKNPEMLIEALNIVNEKNKVTVIVGDGELTESLKMMVKEKGLAQQVIFAGGVNSREYFEIFDLLVCTSNWEGLPYTVLESMAASVPVIATDIPGIRELITDCYNGLLVPRNDAASLAAAMENFFTDPDGYSYAMRAKELVVQNYTVMSMIDKLMLSYQPGD
ncbi:glycosyltransferase family 4 protein [Paenibacillus assamensis]|uniref:glycosyltransferase family 4 protein n=1 Tax=Paenibacillus assamensis TaxID=311244 RepID=UPI00041E3D4F|nr:glycosyltransferase family 4 protein [Paenibacillus assamensis]